MVERIGALRRRRGGIAGQRLRPAIRRAPRAAVRSRFVAWRHLAQRSSRVLKDTPVAAMLVRCGTPAEGFALAPFIDLHLATSYKPRRSGRGGIDESPSSISLSARSSARNGVSDVKRTYQPSKLVRKRRHGFRKRM